MKTLADIKRRISVGVRLQCVENTYRPTLNGTCRTVVKIQTVSFAWLQDGSEDKGRSWTEYPKSKDVTIIDADTFQFKLFDDKDHYVRMRFVNES